MMSDDYENPDHLKYYSPGTPHRAHTMGSYPYKVSRIETWSDFILYACHYHLGAPVDSDFVECAE